MPKTFSRHVNEQHAWTEQLLTRIRECYSEAAHFKVTQAAFLARRATVLDSEKRLTRENLAHIHGYMRALGDAQMRSLIHVRRVAGQPDTATSAKWDDMPETVRQACRDHNTESCLAWDADGARPFSEWTKE